jgi:hypothetical protein
MPMIRRSENNSPSENLLAVNPITTDPSEAFQMLIEDAVILESEDRERYEQIASTLLAEVRPQSFLEVVEVKDYVDKFWEEKRWGALLADMINYEKAVRARHPSSRGLDQKEREQVPAFCYQSTLPVIQAFARLQDNSGAARRKLQKDLSQRVQARRENEAPRIGPEKKPN